MRLISRMQGRRHVHLRFVFLNAGCHSKSMKCDFQQHLVLLEDLFIALFGQTTFDKYSGGRISLQTVMESVIFSYSGAGLRSCKSLSSRTEEAFHKVSVLVQDEQNMCCEVVLPNLCHQLEGWKDLLENGEGKVWRFQGLRQQCRTNKQR